MSSHKGKNKSNHTPVFAFDFDGTLCDSVEISIKALNIIAKKKGLQFDYDTLKSNPTEYVFNHLNIKWWQAPYFVYLFRKLQDKLDPSPEVFPYSEDIINKSIELFGKSWIISSTSHRRIVHAIKKIDVPIDKINIISQTGVFTKQGNLSKVARISHISRSDLFYVGDESRDAVAACKSGVHFVGVSWGLHNAKLLKSINNDVIISDPNDLIAYMEMIFNRYFSRTDSYFS